MKPGELVREFHKAMGSPVGEKPDWLPEDRENFRWGLIEEEVNELVEAEDKRDLVNFAKELADVLYVVYGFAVELGIDLDTVFEAVHKSNMTKIDKDGKVKIRPDGKILKPETYEAPDIENIVKK